jgi:hypothetical protein
MTTSHVQDVTPRQADVPVAVATHSTLTHDKTPALNRRSGVGIVDRDVASRGGGQRARKATAAAGLGGAAIGLLLGVILGVLVAGPGWLAVVATTTLVGSLWGTAIGSLALGESLAHRDYAALAVGADPRHETRVPGGSAADPWQLSVRPGM